MSQALLFRIMKLESRVMQLEKLVGDSKSAFLDGDEVEMKRRKGRWDHYDVIVGGKVCLEKVSKEEAQAAVASYAK